jgi:hypothetical protein
MDNRRREIARFPIPNTNKVNVVTVSYPTFPDMRRAYCLTVQPTTIVPIDFSTIHSYDPCEGYRVYIEDSPRYSARKLESLAADPAVLALVEQIHAAIVDKFR